MVIASLASYFNKAPMASQVERREVLGGRGGRRVKEEDEYSTGK
jgi:hypothetical protein